MLWVWFPIILTAVGDDTMVRLMREQSRVPLRSLTAVESIMDILESRNTISMEPMISTATWASNTEMVMTVTLVQPSMTRASTPDVSRQSTMTTLEVSVIETRTSEPFTWQRSMRMLMHWTKEIPFEPASTLQPVSTRAVEFTAEKPVIAAPLDTTSLRETLAESIIETDTLPPDRVAWERVT